MEFSHIPRTPIKKFTGAGVQPTAAQIGFGELAVNYTDSKVYTKDSSGNIVLLTSLPYLSSLTDVQINSPQSDDLLKYDSSAQKWKNNTILDGGNY